MLLICETGIARDSDAIIARQESGAARPGVALEALHQLKRDAFAMREALLAGELDTTAAILRRSWEAKLRTAAGIETPRIEALLGHARTHGALAGKVSGAGGGGFLMLMVLPETWQRVAAALAEAGSKSSRVRLTSEGARCWAYRTDPPHAAQTAGCAKVE